MTRVTLYQAREAPRYPIFVCRAHDDGGRIGRLQVLAKESRPILVVHLAQERQDRAQSALSLAQAACVQDLERKQ